MQRIFKQAYQSTHTTFKDALRSSGKGKMSRHAPCNLLAVGQWLLAMATGAGYYCNLLELGQRYLEMGRSGHPV